MRTPIHDFLRAYCALNSERCHMPGHKGVLNPHDITEINAEAISIIEQSELLAAELFGAGRTLFSCSGSTLSIFAMLTALVKNGAGKRIAATRGAHRSLIDAAILLDLDIAWNLDAANADAVFITSIDYYGNMTPVPKLKADTPVLVDNAHGAYLVFTENHPIRNGAAMVADSAHKTLPALTGAAYLHISKDYFTEERAKHAETSKCLFGTTSPSYLLLESLDLCNRHIALEKERALAAFDAVAGLKADLTQLGYALKSTDPLRITIDACQFGYSGRGLARELANRGVICEMCDDRYTILLFSTVTRAENTARVLVAMREIPRKSLIEPVSRECFELPEIAMRPRAAYFADKKTLPTAKAIGRVCAGVHVTVPPCVPLIMPGEIISSEIAAELERSGLREIDVVA